MIGRAKARWRRTFATLSGPIRTGVPVVGLEPACVAAFRDELLHLYPNHEDAKRLAGQTYLLSEFLEKIGYRPPPLSGKATVHIHCHHAAVMGDAAERAVLDRLGLDYQVPDEGCCGMAGSFGFEKDKAAVSLAIGEQGLLPAVRETGSDQLLIADGFSCREQIRQATGRRALHLADVLHLALQRRGRAAQAAPV
jgi:Fe-S oxidoreductase